MKNRKRTIITVETERLLMLDRKSNLVAPCLQCGGDSRLLTIEAAARRARLSALAIYRLIEAGTLHHIERPTGGLLVCATSLEDFLLNQKGWR